MKQTIIGKFKEKFTVVVQVYPDGSRITKGISPEMESFLESELTLFEKEVREQTLEEVKEFSSSLVQDCIQDCTSEEHQYHEGTWNSYLKLERWVEAKLEELHTPQEGDEKL